MNTDRVLEEYRGYKLLSAFHQSKFQGRVWKEGNLMNEIEGLSINSVLAELKSFVDDNISETARNAGATPDATRLMDGLLSIQNNLSEGQLSMLKAHALAPNHTLTARELAKAAGYKNYQAANLHYGNIGKGLYEFSPINLPKRKDGSPIYTCYFAEAASSSEYEEEWQWKLRSEALNAIEQLGLLS